VITVNCHLLDCVSVPSHSSSSLFTLSMSSSGSSGDEFSVAGDSSKGSSIFISELSSHLEKMFI
jgi:hypothetical protein